MTISTGVVRRALVAAGITLLQMTAKGLGAAAFDSAHDATLPMREGLRSLKPILRAVVTEDIRHFQVRTFHEVVILGALSDLSVGFCVRHLWQQIKGAGGGVDLGGSDTQIVSRSCQATMT